MLLFSVKTIRKKKMKNSTWGCKTTLKFNTLSKPLNSVKSCNFYTLSIKKICTSSDSDLVWIKHLCKSHHQGLLIMKAASPPALDLHCSMAGDVHAGTETTAVEPGHPVLCCWAEQGPEWMATRLRNHWKHMTAYSRWNYSYPQLSTSPFFLFKK